MNNNEKPTAEQVAEIAQRAAVEATTKLEAKAVAPIAAKVKRVKPKSRAQRWADAVSDAREAFEALQNALGELDSIKDEYDDWRSNLPENLENSPVAEKLDAVLDLDITGCYGDVEGLLDEADNIDLPLGFGRD